MNKIIAGFAICIFLIFSVSELFADAREDLHLEYLKLRNTDWGVRDLERWESLKGQCESIVKTSDAEKGAVIFDCASIFERLAEKSDDKTLLGRSEQLFERYLGVANDRYRKSESLLHLGDIALKLGKGEKAAEERYNSVIQNFPDTDAGVRGGERLAALSNDAFGDVSPSTFIESPRLVSLSDRREFRNLPLIVIDPGHGGEDPGALGDRGLEEKDITLAVAREVKRLLETKKIARVRLTRTHDSFVPLMERTQDANRDSAVAFLSIHANSSPAADGHGLETYYLDNTDDEASKKLAERENALTSDATDPSGDLTEIISDLIQRGKLEGSILLARSVHGRVFDEAHNYSKTVRNIGVKKGPFYVLVGAHTPCALIELFFINHELDGKLLATSDFRGKLASGIAAGIEDFLSGAKPPSSAVLFDPDRKRNESDGEVATGRKVSKKPAKSKTKENKRK